MCRRPPRPMLASSSRGRIRGSSASRRIGASRPTPASPAITRSASRSCAEHARSARCDPVRPRAARRAPRGRRGGPSRGTTGLPRKRMTTSATSSSAAVTSATSRMSLSASSPAARLGVGRGECRLETLDALVDHLVAALDHAVGVGEQRCACRQCELAFDHGFGRGEAKRRGLREIESRGGSGVVIAQQRRRMARRGVGEEPRRRVDRDADRGGHLVVAHVADQAPHDLRRGGVVVGVGAERVAQLSHQRRCRDAPARDVADADVHDPVGPLHDVVPVAADLEARAARLVATRGIDAGDPRELGQQAALERHGDAVLLLVALAAVASALAQGAGLGCGRVSGSRPAARDRSASPPRSARAR